MENQNDLEAQNKQQLESAITFLKSSRMFVSGSLFWLSLLMAFMFYYFTRMEYMLLISITATILLAAVNFILFFTIKRKRNPFVLITFIASVIVLLIISFIIIFILGLYAFCYYLESNK